MPSGLRDARGSHSGPRPPLHSAQVNEIRELVFKEFNTTAVLYGKPSYMFTARAPSLGRPLLRPSRACFSSSSKQVRGCRGHADVRARAHCAHALAAQEEKKKKEKPADEEHEHAQNAGACCARAAAAGSRSLDAAGAITADLVEPPVFLLCAAALPDENLLGDAAEDAAPEAGAEEWAVAGGGATAHSHAGFAWEAFF